MAIPSSFLDELRARVSLVSVVGRRVKLARKGREHWGCCPFHNEKTASFSVSDEKGFYHCFGCGAHGSAIDFEMQLGNLGFREAVEKLANEAGLDVPVEAPEQRERAQKAASLYDVMEAACQFFEAKLREQTGREGLDYLRRRGLDDQAIAHFRLGFSPDSKTALKSALTAKGIPEHLLVEAGLLIKPEEGGRDTYDRFRGRVMFPITDRRGRVIAFGGRTLGDGQPKYLNSPDTPLFHKGEVLYNLANAREPALKSGTVVVAEGYMDVIAMSRAGFPFAVAPLGTALTERQIEELWKICAEPTLCFDGDTAGQRAAGRSAERALPLLKPGKSLRFATVPAPEDPDSLIRQQGPQAFQAILDKAEPLFEVVWRTTLADRPTDTPERRAAFEHDLKEKVFGIADKTVQQHYLAQAKDRLYQFFRPQRNNQPGPMAQARPQQRPGRPGAPKVRPTSVTRGFDGRLPGAGLPRLPAAPQVTARQVPECMILAALVNHPALIDEFMDDVGSMSFSSPDLDRLRRRLLAGEHARVEQELAEGRGPAVLLSCFGVNRDQVGFWNRNVDLPDVRQRLGQLLAKMAFISLQADKAAIAGQLAEETTKENLDRLIALLEQGRALGTDQD